MEAVGVTAGRTGDGRSESHPFVGAHLHLRDRSHLRYLWREDAAHASIAPTCAVEDYRREAANWNVVGCVHVDACAHPDDGEAESECLEGGAAAGFIHAPFAPERFSALIHQAIDRFGSWRVMVATNFPTDCLFAGMNTALGAYEALLQGFSDDERRDLWARNAKRICCLGLDL